MMGRPVIPARLCAVNPSHGAAVVDSEIDGRIYRVCARCDGGTVHVDGYQWRTPSRDEIMTAIAASPGVESSALADEMLDVDDVDADDLAAAKRAFSTLIGRMAGRGEIVRARDNGKRNSRLWLKAVAP